MYRSKIWTLNKSATDMLNKSEKKYLGKTIDSILENGMWRRRKIENSMKFIKSLVLTSA